MWSRNCFCSFCYVDLIFACFYLTGQLQLIQQKFQLAGVVLVVSNPHVFNLTGQLESKPPEFPTLAAIDPCGCLRQSVFLVLVWHDHMHMYQLAHKKHHCCLMAANSSSSSLFSSSFSSSSESGFFLEFTLGSCLA